MNEYQLEVIKLAVKAVIQEELAKVAPHRCPLEDIGISAESHKAHHRTLRCLGEDWVKLRTAFVLGAVTMLTGGIAGLIWLGLKVKLFAE